MRAHRVVGVLAAALLAGPVLTGCGGSDSGGGSTAPELLAQAKTTLDAARSLHFVLTSTGAPATGTAVLGGAGDVLRPSSFAGTLQVRSAVGTVDVAIVSVDGTVYAQLPFAPAYSVVDPATLGFGDPGKLIDPDTGISQLLTKATSPKLGDESRVAGERVREVTADVPGDLVDQLLTTADPTQPVHAVLSIATGSDELRRVALTGPFFAAGQDATYTIELSDYGADVQITAPATG